MADKRALLAAFRPGERVQVYILAEWAADPAGTLTAHDAEGLTLSSATLAGEPVDTLYVPWSAVMLVRRAPTTEPPTAPTVQ